MKVYLDYAAATPMDDAVLDGMKPYLSEKFYNPSANYLSARTVKDDVLEAKKSIADALGAKYSEIIHSSGGTESNNLAICGIMDNFPDKKVLVSSTEHESVIKPAEKYQYELIPVDENGLVELAALEKMINDDVVLISIMLVNNETGTIQPIRKIAEVAKKINKSRHDRAIELPLYIHTDACQAPCFLDIHTNRLGVDMMTLNGGKIYGPKGSGILFVKTGVAIKPQILGGGQQRGLRSGTENPAAIIGFARALEITSKKRLEESGRLEKLRNRLIDGIMDTGREVIINGHNKHRTPHILNITFTGVDNERLLFQLDEAGIMAASGSACSASSQEPSHVLGAMGLSDELSRNTLRFSFGRNTIEKEIDYVAAKLKELLA